MFIGFDGSAVPQLPSARLRVPRGKLRKEAAYVPTFSKGSIDRLVPGAVHANTSRRIMMRIGFAGDGLHFMAFSLGEDLCVGYSGRVYQEFLIRNRLN
jgi:hypothetical protein